MEPLNRSANRGYAHYRATGEISDVVHARVQASEQMRIYREIAAFTSS